VALAAVRQHPTVSTPFVRRKKLAASSAALTPISLVAFSRSAARTASIEPRSTCRRARPVDARALGGGPGQGVAGSPSRGPLPARHPAGHAAAVAEPDTVSAEKEESPEVSELKAKLTEKDAEITALTAENAELKKQAAEAAAKAEEDTAARAALVEQSLAEGEARAGEQLKASEAVWEGAGGRDGVPARADRAVTRTRS
jgi:hypothetical protein